MNGKAFYQFGDYNLCWNTRGSAFRHCLAHTTYMAGLFEPDIVLLDNQAPFLCYCATCRREFINYLRSRFHDNITDWFGLDTAALDTLSQNEIISSPALLKEWEHYAKYVSIDAINKTRSAMRDINTNMHIMANSRFIPIFPEIPAIFNGRNQYDYQDIILFELCAMPLPPHQHLKSKLNAERLLLSYAAGINKPTYAYAWTWSHCVADSGACALLSPSRYAICSGKYNCA